MATVNSRTLSRALVEFGKDFAGAPADLIILGLLAIAVASDWQTGRELTRVCEVLAGNDFAATMPAAQKQEISAICIKSPSPE